jgi:hypothetical protein
MCSSAIKKLMISKGVRMLRSTANERSRPFPGWWIVTTSNGIVSACIAFSSPG